MERVGLMGDYEILCQQKQLILRHHEREVYVM